LVHNAAEVGWVRSDQLSGGGRVTHMTLLLTARSIQKNIFSNEYIFSP
jgi:hypothetical protein